MHTNGLDALLRKLPLPLWGKFRRDITCSTCSSSLLLGDLNTFQSTELWRRIALFIVFLGLGLWTIVPHDKSHRGTMKAVCWLFLRWSFIFQTYPLYHDGVSSWYDDTPLLLIFAIFLVFSCIFCLLQQVTSFLQAFYL
jgi:hypothetical protein